jgi:hypothetical protein
MTTVDEQPQPKRRKVIVKRRQQISRANREIQAILRKVTEQQDVFAPGEKKQPTNTT